VDATEFEVEWSKDISFANANSTTTTANHLSINTPSPLALVVVYVRARARGGQWSPVSEKWTAADTCDIVSQYLNTTNTLKDWHCRQCPDGAYCRGTDVTWDNVKALFGWWRHTTGPLPSNFTRCLFPPACLGAPNPEFKGQFQEDSRDPSQIDQPESCALASGYAVACGGDGAPRCRLCATCAFSYRRKIMDDMARCDKCPAQASNRWLLAGGALLALALLAFLVRMNLNSGGIRTTSEMYQVIIINYLQLSSMVVGMDVPWPDALQYIFNVQGAISTLGEHLLSPDCELTDLRPADLLYRKQMAYVAMPYGVSALSWAFWRLVSVCKCKRWTAREGSEPSYLDKHISTVVFLLYLLFPTMCTAALALLVSKPVNGQRFLQADLQEPFLQGQHLLYVCVLTIPQLCLVLGLPGVGFWIVRRHAKAIELHRTKVQFRYGLLYSGYNYQRWGWDVVVALRKMMVAVVSTCVLESQVHAMVFVLALAFFLNERGQPYRDDEDTRRDRRLSLHNLDSNAIAMVGVTAWTGLFFKLSPHCEHASWSCLGLVVVVAALNILFFAHCVYLFFLNVLEVKVKRLLATWKRCCCKPKNIPTINTVISTFEAGTAFVNPMTGDATFNNPMYRSRRTSTLHSSILSRDDGVELVSATSMLKRGRTELEKLLLDETKRLKADKAALEADKATLEADKATLVVELNSIRRRYNVRNTHTAVQHSPHTNF